MSSSAMNQHEKAYQAWKEHNSMSRWNTDLATAEFLRASHPGFHVTRADPCSCDLLGYAKAGFATVAQHLGEAYDGTRAFKAPRRLEKAPGQLTDRPSFARYQYTWDSKDFIVYQVCYETFLGSPVSRLSILAANVEGALVDGHHRDTDALMMACGEWTKELHEEIQIFDDQRWIKSRELYKSVMGMTWDDVILDREMKANLIRDVQEFFDNREIYKNMNVPWKRGVILHGVPGNGKTFSIKALINSLATRPEPIPSLYVKSLDSSHGAKWSINSIFEHARKMSPCLLIFEDLDSMVEEKVRSYFLNEVDGLESNEGILMIGSTNHLARLDSSITKRPSRFDRKYHFQLPGDVERLAYCRFWRSKFVGSATVDFPVELCAYLAAITEGFSFAYLKELFITSLLALARGSTGASVDVEETEGSVTDTSEAVVVEKPEDTAASDAPQDADAAAKVEEDAGRPVASKKRKRDLPEVDVPESLADNALFKITSAQAKALLGEMDSSDLAPESKKWSGSGLVHHTGIAIPMPSRRIRAIRAEPDSD